MAHLQIKASLGALESRSSERAVEEVFAAVAHHANQQDDDWSRLLVKRKASPDVLHET